MKEFGKVIKKLRKEKDLSQEELACALNVSKSTVAMWETDKRLPSNTTLNQIADFFNVDTDYLLGRKVIKINDNNLFPGAVIQDIDRFTTNLSETDIELFNELDRADERTKKAILSMLKQLNKKGDDNNES